EFRRVLFRSDVLFRRLIGERDDDDFGENGRNAGGDEAVSRNKNEVGDDVEEDAIEVDLQEFRLVSAGDQGKAEESGQKGEDGRDHQELESYISPVMTHYIPCEEFFVHNEAHEGASEDHASYHHWEGQSRKEVEREGKNFFCFFFRFVES